jgi:uncharacterized protein
VILYLDTSALLKLYLEEPDSSTVRNSVSAAAASCTHAIAYPEMRAALAQAHRIRRIGAAELASHRQRFDSDWRALQVILVDEPMVRRAGDLAEQYGLRGYDSVHLAAAESIWRAVPDEFCLAAFDLQLNVAAQQIGMSTLAGH